MSNYIKKLIASYEQNILGKTYSFTFSNGESITFAIRKKNVPHLLGIGKLPLRQTQGKFSMQIYNMLKSGSITMELINRVPQNKEVIKKILNFHCIIQILNEGDAVKVVKRIGSLKSDYLLYLDDRPNKIVHLGIAEDENGNWYPESLLILNKRNIEKYIDGQLPLTIVLRTIDSK